MKSALVGPSARKDQTMLAKLQSLGFLTVFALASSSVHASSLWSVETHQLAFGDFNGDGKTDMLYVADDATQLSGILLSDGTGPLNSTQLWSSGFLGIPWHSRIYKPFVADFTGDGKADIFLQRQTPGEHYLLATDAQGQVAAIAQTLPFNHGGHIWSSDSHRIITGDFNGDGRADVFLQSVKSSDLNAVFLAGSNGHFAGAQQTWADNHLGFGWSFSKALVYAADFTADGKADLFVQGKPGIVIIEYDPAFPVPVYRPGSFGIAPAKSPSGGEIFYAPALQIWDRSWLGVDWSAANYEAIVGDFNGDGRADVFLQGRTGQYANRLLIATSAGQFTSGDALLDPTLRSYTIDQFRMYAVNFDGTNGVGLYAQGTSSSATSHYAANITAASVSFTAHAAPPMAIPAVQAETSYTAATRYNRRGQLVGSIAADPDGNGPLKYLAKRHTYNSRGLLAKVEVGELSAWLNETIAPEDWSGHAIFTIMATAEFRYDDYGRKTVELMRGTNGAIESAVQVNYGTNGLVRCKAIRMNPHAYGSLPSDACTPGPEGQYGPDRITRFGYDRLDQLVLEERGVGIPGLQQAYVTNTYEHRLLRTQVDANGNKSELRYDDYGRVKRRVYPSATVAGTVNEGDYNEYFYDYAGNQTSERKRDGTMITYIYDDKNQVITKDLSDNTHSADVYFDYDNRGFPLHSRFGSDTGAGEAVVRDAFGRVTSRSTNVGGTVRQLSYRYDANGNRTRITHSDGYFFEYEFDGLDRVKSVASSNTTSPTSATTSLLAVEYGANGKRLRIVRPGSAMTTYLRDNAQRLESFTQSFTNSSDNLENSFSYNPAGQITRLIQGNNQYNFTALASRTGVYVPNGLNQYTSIAGQAIGYDAKGNLASDGGVNYLYDMENRLVATSGSATSALLYDTVSRLVQLTVAGTTTQFLYDGDALVAEYVGGNLTRRYVHGDEVDEPWVQYNGSGTATSDRRFLFADHQGSIIAHANNLGGVLNRIAYDAYGDASGLVGRFGFTGQAWIAELGVYHYKARMYHPKLGRFLQTDPVFYGDGMNLYAYVGNDPVNKSDPSGLTAYDCTRGLGKGNCKAEAPVRAGDTITVGNKTYTITHADSISIGFTVNTEQMTADGLGSCGAPQVVMRASGSPAASSEPGTSHTLGEASDVADTVNNATGVIENGVPKDIRLGSRGRQVYPNGWRGNQYGKTVSPSAVARVGSHVSFAAVAGMETWRYKQGQVSRRKYGTDMGVAIIGLAHPFTFGVSLSYFIMDPVKDQPAFSAPLGPYLMEVIH